MSGEEPMSSNAIYKIYKSPGWITEICMTIDKILHIYATRRITNISKNDVYTGPDGTYSQSIEFTEKDHSKYTIYYPTFGRAWYRRGMSVACDYVDITKATSKNKQVKARCYVSEQGLKTITKDWPSKKYNFYTPKNFSDLKSRPDIHFVINGPDYNPFAFAYFNREEIYYGPHRNGIYEILFTHFSRPSYANARISYRHAMRI
jgi:hypothetical protein